MRKRSISIALVGGLVAALPALALAGPWDGARGKAPARADKNGAQVRVKAGKGRLGVSVLEISPELRAHLGAPRDRGVLVNSVLPDSPAARAGIAVGDLVTAVDGDAVDGAAAMLGAMSDRKKGESVSIALVRSGKAMTVTARLDSDPGSFDVGVSPGAWRGLDRGFPLGDPDLRRDLERAQKRIQELEKRLDTIERAR